MPWTACTSNAATTSCKVIWNTWNNGAAVTAYDDWSKWGGTTGADGTCWIRWTTNDHDTWTQYATIPTPPPETKEQRQQREQRAREIQAECAARQKVAAAAEKKAEELFREHLNETQKKEVAEKRHFHVISEKGKRFRIHLDSAHGNVSELGADGKVKKRYCAQPKELPKFDQILAQKLVLEHCEEQFLKVANAS